VKLHVHAGLPPVMPASLMPCSISITSADAMIRLMFVSL
jgi:hypothetical protein